MTYTLRRQRRITLALEQLERRLVPAGTLTIPLDPTLDQFGDQIVTVQAYGSPASADMSIFDTGASALTFSADSQALFTEMGAPIPVKVPGGAQSSGIGGDVTGDVSQPGTVFADGMHAFDLSFDSFGFPLFNLTLGPQSAAADGVQAFIGTTTGSPDLPTITGTPILNPSTRSPHGLAASIDMQGYNLDFSDLIPGLTLAMPDLHFVDPNVTLTASTGTTAPVYIPLTSFGSDNHLAPGDAITESPSPFQNDVTVATGGHSIPHNGFLLDTGAQLSVVSTKVATELGLDLAHPETTITVQGVGGSEDVPGYTLDELDVPTTDGGTLQFTHVPIYVLDVADGIDGILGMNLWNTASKVVYDPFNDHGSQLGLTFFTSPDRGSGVDDGTGLSTLFGNLGRSLASTLHGKELPGLVLGSAEVSGQVYQDTNGNGSHDTGEPGLANWTVYLDQTVNGKLVEGVKKTETDSSGHYAFTELQAGQYAVREVAPTGWAVSSAAGTSQTISLQDSAQVSGVDFGNVQPASVSGQLFNDLNDSGNKDKQDPGLPNWTVSLDTYINGKLISGFTKTTTDASGNYSFTGLKPGTYVVHATIPAGWFVTAPSGGGVTVALTSGQGNTSLDFGAFQPVAAAPTVVVTVPAPTGLADAASALTHSAESYRNFIAAAYQKYLGRSPEAAGLDDWLNRMLQGLSDEQLEAGFIGSAEYIAQHGGTGSAWIQGMYTDLLGRSPDAAGLAYWEDQLAQGVQPQDIAFGFAASAEREGMRVGGDYLSYLGRAPVASEAAYWVDRFLNGANNEDVIAGFVASQEYYDRQGNGTTATWVTHSYQSIFHRAASQAEINYWVGVLNG